MCLVFCKDLLENENNSSTNPVYEEGNISNKDIECGCNEEGRGVKVQDFFQTFKV